MKILTAIAAAAVLSAAAAPHAGAQQRGTAQPAQETQAQLRREARVGEAQARRTALAAVRNGRVKSHELEREHGHLIYSYDISVPGRAGIEEVTVDAVTGRIVTHEHESPAAERAEARQEAAEGHHHAP
ncbi:MAG: PepSY domain-containing protein [Longimicrobiaceae bacterium]